MPQAGDFNRADSQRAHARRTAFAELKAVYRLADAAYRPYSCPGTAECCQLAATQREPWLWPVEWELLWRPREGWCPRRAPTAAVPSSRPTGKRCSVYASRPFGCRTFFCHRIRGPAREPMEAVALLFQRLERVAQALDADGCAPRPLLAWAAEAREKKPSGGR